MPLVAGGELVGLVDLYDDAERDWTDDLEFLTGVCQLVAGVFDSTALLGEAASWPAAGGAGGAGRGARPRRRAEGHRGARRDAAAARDRLRGLRHLVARGGVSPLPRERRRQRRGRRGPRQHPAPRLLPGHRAGASRDREILVISSLDDERVTDYERDDYLEWDFHSAASVPLVSNDEVVGLIDLFDSQPRDFNDVRPFLREAGRTVADALRNAELLARLRRGNAALRELVELGDRLNEAGTLEDLAREVAERLRSLLAADDCDIWQVDGGVLRCLASVDSRGWDADEVGSERELATYEATVAALSANEPLVVGDLAQHQPLRGRDDGLPSLGLSQHGLSPAGGRGPRHRADRRLRHQGARLHPAPRHDPQRRAAARGVVREGDAGRATGAGQPRPEPARRLQHGVRRDARRGRGAAHGGGAPPGGLGGRPVRRLPGWTATRWSCSSLWGRRTPRRWWASGFP